jgi:hypothetical protein
LALVQNQVLVLSSLCSSPIIFSNPSLIRCFQFDLFE